MFVVIDRTSNPRFRIVLTKGGNSFATLSGSTWPGYGRTVTLTPSNPISVDGNATLQVTMTDYGSPGTSDTIGITVWNKLGGTWFSSNWVGTPPATVEQKLGGGDLSVH